MQSAIVKKLKPIIERQIGRIQEVCQSTLQEIEAEVFCDVSPEQANRTENTFRRDGHFWKMAIFGLELPPMRHRAGYLRISTLLINPGRPITPLELTGAGSTAVDLKEESIDQEGLNLSSGSAELYEDFEKKDIDLRLRTRLKEMAREREEAAGNQAAIARLDDEMSWIEKECNRFFGKEKLCYDPSAPNEKARKAVSKSIEEALAEISQSAHQGNAGAAKLHEHLRTFLEFKHGTWVYKVDRIIFWDTG